MDRQPDHFRSYLIREDDMSKNDKVTWQVDWHKPRTAVIANHQGARAQSARERLEQLVGGVITRAIEEGEASVTIRVARVDEQSARPEVK
jgi:hypothetical protein